MEINIHECIELITVSSFFISKITDIYEHFFKKYDKFKKKFE